MPSCPSRATGCTRSRSARSTPASSSPAISASPPTARPSCGSKNAWAMPQGHRRPDGGRRSRPRRPMLAGRVSGDSTVAYALGLRSRRRGRAGHEGRRARPILRALMAELERIANHLGDFGAICNDAAFAIMLAHCGALRERVLRASDAAFGHRLMQRRDRAGRRRPATSTRRASRSPALVAEIGRRFPHLVELYDKTASLQDRTVATGIVRPELARRFAAGGFVGRASGRGFDARKAALSALRPPGLRRCRCWRKATSTRASGSASARSRRASASSRKSSTNLPEGPIVEADIRSRARRARAWRSSKASAATSWPGCGSAPTAHRPRCHLRDPSWFQWPLLEAAIEGNIVADFPLCNKSFNCSYSGHDL